MNQFDILIEKQHFLQKFKKNVLEIFMILYNIYDNRILHKLFDSFIIKLFREI